ncbi:MAG: SUMF1/EgtB/PvdO family nonheme iron enzyme [Methylococcus sp.]
MSTPTEPTAPPSAALLTHLFGGGGLLTLLFMVLDKLDVLNGALEAPDKLAKVFNEMPAWLWWLFLVGFLTATLMYLALLIRQIKERRAGQRLLTAGGETPRHYFRIGPYGPEDRADFHRADGAERDILRWLETAPDKAMPLYLTGDSGSGKSSLLYAYLLPELADRGWKVVQARAHRDPVASLRSELAGPEDEELSLRDLVERAARDQKLLLVLDQFEEFLILAPPEAKQRFAALVAELAARPNPNLRLLLVLRNDYEDRLMKPDLRLPLPDWSHNFHPLGRFDFAAAHGFLTDPRSPLRAAGVDLERLLESAARLDNSQGLIRPVTLNVLGKILTETGAGTGALAGGLDAGRLVQGYLARTVEQPGIRDHAHRVVAHLVSAEATKQPRTLAELVEDTGLELPAVQKVLNALGQAGLARRLEHQGAVHWELSHDFVARAFNTYLGRRRADVWRMTLAYGSSLLVGGLLAGAVVYAMAVALPARAEREPMMPEMVDIPAGSFCMGSQGEAPAAAGDLQNFIRGEEEKSRASRQPALSDCPELPLDPEASPNEMPARRVAVPAFRLGKYEVTAGEFSRYVRAMQARGRELNWTDEAQAVNALPPGERALKDRLPAVNVSYYEAVAYAEWLWEETGRNGPKYRLPTEAEWEYAARAGSLTRRWWGDDPKHEDACAHANVLDRKARQFLGNGVFSLGWQSFACETDGYVWSAPVGRYGAQGANAFGLQDMLGNVWEWVADCYHPSYAGAPAGLAAWTDGTECATGRRVIRGGSWDGDPADLRSATRDGDTPDFRYGVLGFRLAQD